MKNQIKIGKINGSEIFAINYESGEILVPIKQICAAIGVDMESQRQKIKEDEILNSVAVLSTATGTDGKLYVMLCLPLEYVYGWIFTINHKNVAPEVKQQVIKYRKECYHALYRNFFGRADKQLEANKAEIAQLETINRLMIREKEVKADLKKARESLAQIRAGRLDDQPSLFD